MSILEKLKKNSTIKATQMLSESEFFSERDRVSTDIPALNIALSGSVYGGFLPGLTFFAAPSKHFKTNFSLLMVSSYMKKYPDAVCLFYDSEYGATPEYFSNMGVDASRVVHTPITNVEELKFDLVAQLEAIEKGDRVIIMIDSIGNLASKKEVDDAKEQKSVADMSRAKALKSLFRIATPYLTSKCIPMIAVNHTYQTIELYAKTIMGGGCLAPETNVVMADGSVKQISEIVVGEFVKTLDGNKEVIQTWNPETLVNGTPECLEIEFKDGNKIVCSETHKFLKGGEWVEARHLKVNDAIYSV
jgi:recA bacterial DNA recombination protein|nr:MAG TPA: Recombination and repair protein [Caudoviricetes sp.]